MDIPQEITQSFHVGEEKTAVDLVNEMDELEAEAEATLSENWGVEGKCTFDDGYISQPVYSCLTCAKDTPVGVCFGCSLQCHLNHNIVELFDKRNFRFVFYFILILSLSHLFSSCSRCDCGVAVTQHKCHFDPNGTKQTLQNTNSYNHNYQNKYCWCRQVYDPQRTMYQCYLCQDWFHEKCIDDRVRQEGKFFDSDELTSLVCSQCFSHADFILSYRHLLVIPYLENEAKEEQKEASLPIQGNTGTQITSESNNESLTPTSTSTLTQPTSTPPLTTTESLTSHQPKDFDCIRFQFVLFFFFFFLLLLLLN
jgi:E3 ubiquitin-protein ligase UBR7